jgi:5-methylcytosine-specific restriction endonuclease McrA
MGKQALRNCQIKMVKTWAENPATAVHIQDELRQFWQAHHKRSQISAIIYRYETSYINEEISREEYSAIKKQLERDYGHEIKFLKNLQRKLFETMFHLVLIAGSKNKCYLCGCDLNRDCDYSRDHVFPDSHGFSLSGNMMPVHRLCNLGKGNRLPTSRELKKVIEAYEFAGLEFAPREKLSRGKTKFDYTIVLAAE